MLSILTQFGYFSGYKLNLNKSELFPVHELALALNYTNLPFKIVKGHFTYLGITITRKYSSLFKENFLTLINQVKQSLMQWSPLWISLIGRINSIKMNILPKFLYLFQSIPIFIPKSFFDSLDSIISSFIWKGKRPRISKVHLQKPKDAGGLALPNFRFYYWAANIRCVVFWFHFYNHTDCPAWVSMEVNSAINPSIPGLLSSHLPLPPNNSSDNPVVKHTLRVWVQFRKHFDLYDLSLLSPILSNHLFQPSLDDPMFQVWYRQGIKRLKDLYLHDIFASFEQLSEKYKLQKTHFF